ncbi:hypothetical protein GCM10022254_01140 [Actinomadura meridiana]|uniref:Methyltransferase domain-containing protein n=1 Tax=Actinomadura meridiana TaxID=559626 RepID=A0ABP8BRM8_9ACTN
MMGNTGYDAELQGHNEMLRRAADVQPHDHVLDIGCGAGQTTRQAGQAAHAGSALGLDVSAPAIERARELTRTDGPRNVTFERADAQTYSFPPECFDLAISRFGTMFFADPAAAFTEHPPGAAPVRTAGDGGLAVRRAQRMGGRHPPGP